MATTNLKITIVVVMKFVQRGLKIWKRRLLRKGSPCSHQLSHMYVRIFHVNPLKHGIYVKLVQLSSGLSNQHLFFTHSKLDIFLLFRNRGLITKTLQSPSHPCPDDSDLPLLRSLLHVLWNDNLQNAMLAGRGDLVDIGTFRQAE